MPWTREALMAREHPDGLVTRARTASSLFHKECWRYLRGDGSSARPYECRCGMWVFDPGYGDYRLTRDIDIEGVIDE